MSDLRNSQIRILAIAVTLAAIGYGRQAAAGSEQVEFEVVSPVEVRLAGTSTLHSWNCVGDRLDLSTRIDLAPDEFHTAVEATWAGELPLPIDFNGNDEFAGNPKFNGAPLLVRVPINSLECNRSRMQRDLRETVKYEKHPVIEYKLEAIRDSAISDEERRTVILEVTGRLTVAGVPRSVDHRVEITRFADGRFQVRGELDLKMSWFDMDPPTALLGLLRAHNEFRVEFLFQAEINKS